MVVYVSMVVGRPSAILGSSTSFNPCTFFMHRLKTSVPPTQTSAPVSMTARTGRPKILMSQYGRGRFPGRSLSISEGRSGGRVEIRLVGRFFALVDFSDVS